MCRICTVQIQPRRPVIDDTDCTPSARQHELDHTDHADHIDQGSISPEGARWLNGNGSSVSCLPLHKRFMRDCLLETYWWLVLVHADTHHFRGDIPRSSRNCTSKHAYINISFYTIYMRVEHSEHRAPQKVKNKSETFLTARTTGAPRETLCQTVPSVSISVCHNSSSKYTALVTTYRHENILLGCHD